MGEFPNSTPIKVTDRLLSQAVELMVKDESDLYASLGLSTALWENLQGVDLAPFELGVKARLPPPEKDTMTFLMKEGKLEVSAALPKMRLGLVKKGETFFEKHREKLFQKICVKGQACKWSKEILGDTKALLTAIIPLVGAALGITVPAIVITIAILILKWGIIKFCKCKP